MTSPSIDPFAASALRPSEAPHASVRCRQCGEVLTPSQVSGGVERVSGCRCGGGRNAVSAVEHRQQQLAG